MSQPLSLSASKQCILERVIFLVSSGRTLAAACALIEDETGQNARTTKTQYRRAREVVVRTSGAALKTHGNRKLTERQEEILVAVLMVQSGTNQGVSDRMLAEHVERLFGVSVSRGWARCFLERHKDVSKPRRKLLAKKRAAAGMSGRMAGVERCSDDVEMTAAAATCSLGEARSQFKIFGKGDKKAPKMPSHTVTHKKAPKMRSHTVTHPLLHAEIEPAEQQTELANVEVQHEALIGDELTTERAIERNPTVATLGETPFSTSGGGHGHGHGHEETEYHKVVATEVVANPVQWSEPEPVLQNALVIVDPRVADCLEMVASAKRRGLFVTAVVPKPNTTARKVDIYPTAVALLEAGVHQVYEPPVGSHFDVTECANHLQTLEAQQNLRFLGVVPLRESAVDVSDVLAALLGLAIHNDLGLASARRDKGLMKMHVANAGLRVAKFARLTASDGSDVPAAVRDLDLDFPVVVKTPRGMSTMDVYICDTLDEAVRRSGEIVRSIGPDGKKALFSLLEEFIAGDEFAVNIVASPTMLRGVQVTDLWKYNKLHSEGTYINTWQTMVDPHCPRYASLVRYGEGIARAVGIKYGMAHVEIKAKYDNDKDRYVDPVMIEVGARLAGGRKAIMAQATIPGWLPFDAMVDAHCGFPVRVPPSFRPVKVARHVYVPTNKVGVIKSMKGTDFDRLPTYNAHMMLVDVGSKVRKSTDLYSFAGYVWLVGTEEDVERDTAKARGEFEIEVESE